MDKEHEENLENEFAENLLAQVQRPIDNNQDELCKQHTKEWRRNL